MKLNSNVKFSSLPNQKDIDALIETVKKYIFLGYFEEVKDDENYRAQKRKELETLYIKITGRDSSNLFLLGLEKVDADLSKDLDFFYESDPACENKEEIVLAYPGYLAIFYYRLAHLLDELKVPVVPRLISEKAHSLTGIDIHPGAKIDAPFFIDHGTGIVIGETTEIGKFVKIYQGVTLGALSLKKGRDLRGSKRHPTIKDYVTIYSESSILGGDTVIGERVTIGSNVFIVNSVLNDTTVVYQENKIKYLK